MKNKVLYGLLLLMCVLGCVLIFYFVKGEDDTPKTDAVKFHEEYTNVPVENVFVYRDVDEIIQILEHGTGIVYLGFPECQWCQAYVPMLNEVATELGVEKIYYYNIKQARSDNTEKYQRIVELLGDNLLYDEEGKRRVYVPDVSVVQEGVVVGHNNESSVVTEEDGTPKEYWTEERKEALKLNLEEMIQRIMDSSCSSCGE